MIAPRQTLLALLVACACALPACSTPESKVESFNKRGQALLAKGDLVKARLEFQNALQVNPSAVPSLFGLAVVAERSRDWRASYELLGKVLELQPTHLEALVKIGKLQLASGQLDKAMATSAAAYAVKADSPDALGLRAAVFLKLNEPGQAIAAARQALAVDPQHIDTLVVLATERLNAGDADGGVAFLDRALASNERNVSLQILKVQALEKLGRSDRAEEVLNKLVKLFPEHLEYRHLLASFHVAHKQPAKAEAEYRAVIAANPKAAAPKLQLVGFLQSSQGLAPAAAELEAFSRADPKSSELKLALAQLRLQQKQDAAAIALWNEIIESGDRAAGIRARGSLAAYRLARGDKETARSLVAQMLEKDARDEQALFLRAGIAMEERKLDDAVADLRTILRDTPESPRAQLLLAHAHELQGQRDLATQHYAGAAQVANFAPAFALPYAHHLLRTGRARQAEGVLRDVLRVTPGHAGALKLLADSYLRSGDVAAAQALADQVAKAATTDATASQVLGAVQIARKDFAAGIESYKHAYSLAPSDLQALSAVVRGYLAAGRPADAIAFVQAVVKAAPDNQGVRVLQGQLLAQTGQSAAAVEALQAAIALQPKNVAPYLALVSVHLAGRSVDAALAVADQGLAAVPGDFALRVTRATALDAAGKPDEAIAAFEKLLAERPNAAIVANNLASLLADHRKDAESIRRAYDIAQRFRGSDVPHLKDTLGWTTHLVGKHAEAAELLKSARAQAPELPVVHYHYGMNQLVLNNPENAREALKRSIELSKATPFAQLEEARKALESL